MKRRGLLTFLGAAPLLSRPSRAQRAMPLVGFMNPVSADTYPGIGFVFWFAIRKGAKPSRLPVLQTRRSAK